MAARKLQQEVDKCFKKVSEGVAEFESIYEKIEQSTNAAQKEKLEDNLKREIKKLQRLRDQIKTWAASNDIKDKGPLLDHRKLIETQMEKFKAVEKAMKTKAYSKEGLLSQGKMDPKERAKIEADNFLTNSVDELERQKEALEAEAESIQATMKKGKANTAKAERMAEIERIIERHKWHQGKLELIKRSLENGGVESEQVTELEETIKYYISDGMNDDFMEDDEMYDDLNLQEEEDAYGMNNDNDRVSSQDTQSIQEDTPDPDTRSNSLPSGKSKAASNSEPPFAAARRPSTQMKSPLPALATLHTPITNVSTGSTPHMKPAAVPTRAPGETLKYASAAAAAAASDKIGIAPLPPPPEALSNTITNGSHPPLPSHSARRTSATASPSTLHSQPASAAQTPVTKSAIPVLVNTVDGLSSSQTKSPALSHSSAGPSGVSVPQTPAGSARPGNSRVASGQQGLPQSVQAVPREPNGVLNGSQNEYFEEDESIYHLPSGLQDLLQSFETAQQRVSSVPSPQSQRMLAQSRLSCPSATDLEPPRNYKPENRYTTPAHYPQEVPAIFDDPRFYSRIEPDTLFYIFYYKQQTYQQYLAAKALKDQSWRFHKQYQTWFQRHEEPKTITEEYEQGTYRFFDYESTWMNRRKADFKFAYKFLEDDV
ncbi:General negative regulator of transcription subunit 3 [Phlyctema vagabunda]|uniref:General negative regulator of transcription subunit n=1 Tax=Phlyctema vagabunda TaxID=108571 RepID=A0ABR4PLL4_9HELO